MDHRLKSGIKAGLICGAATFALNTVAIVLPFLMVRLDVTSTIFGLFSMAFAAFMFATCILSFALYVLAGVLSVKYSRLAGGMADYVVSGAIAGAIAGLAQILPTLIIIAILALTVNFRTDLFGAFIVITGTLMTTAMGTMLSMIGAMVYAIIKIQKQQAGAG